MEIGDQRKHIIRVEHYTIFQVILTEFIFTPLHLCQDIFFSYLYFETDRYYDFCIVIRKKIKRLIIPYVSTMVLWVIPFYCFFWKPEAKILIEKFVLGTSPSQLWFLLMLFWQFVLFQALSSKILAKKKTTIVWGFVFALCIYGGMILGRVGVPNFYQILTAMQYSLFFYFWNVVSQN